MAKYEYQTREELIETAISLQNRLRRSDKKLVDAERKLRRGQYTIMQRYLQLEKQNDNLLYLVYKLYSDIATLTNTEPPSFSMVRSALIPSDTTYEGMKGVQ